MRSVFASVLLLFAASLLGWGAGAFNYYEADGLCSASFVNVHDVDILGLFLEFDTRVEFLGHHSLGGAMTVMSNVEGRVFFAGRIEPAGYLTVEWLRGTAKLNRAVWLEGQQAFAEIDVHSPVAKISIMPTVLICGQMLRFLGHRSIDPDGGDVIRHVWLWSDGLLRTGSDVERAFETPGPHTVSLTVMDTQGQMGVTEQTFIVFADEDEDGVIDQRDGCPEDAGKIAPGRCGCGVPDEDRDNDGVPDCHDAEPDNPNVS